METNTIRIKLENLKAGDKIAAGYRTIYNGKVHVHIPSPTEYKKRNVRIEFAIGICTVEEVTEIRAGYFRIKIAGIPQPAEHYGYGYATKFIK
jgi:hypothetical protein